MSNNFRTATVLISVFRKLGIYDEGIRGILVAIYRPVITTILRNTTSPQRIVIFKKLLPVILNTSKSLKDDKASIYRAVQNAIEFSTYLISTVGLSNSSTAFNKVFHQINIDDITCEIGGCIREFKESTNKIEKYEIKTRLELLISDYNTISTDSVDLDTLLAKPIQDENEL